jgi:hypothetical protein
MKSAKLFTIHLGLTLVLGLVACSDDDSEGGHEGGGQLEIGGEYIDEFMTAHSITDDEWSFSGSIYIIAEFDNEAMYVLAQNGEANTYYPGLWSRFDWAWAGEQLYYCQIVYDGASIEDARATSADANDLLAGCNGFSWTKLNPL